MKEAVSKWRGKAALSKWQENQAIINSSSQLAVGKTASKADPKAQETPSEPEKPKRRRQGKFTLKDLNYPDQRVVRFPMAVGKKTEMVELLTSANLHYITVEFADRTSLSFMIEPAFTFSAAYEYLEKGKPRAKLWPEIQSRK